MNTLFFPPAGMDYGRNSIVRHVGLVWITLVGRGGQEAGLDLKIWPI